MPQGHGAQHRACDGGMPEACFNVGACSRGRRRRGKMEPLLYDSGARL